MIATMPPQLTRRELLRLAASAGSTLAFPSALAACGAGRKRGNQWFRAAKPADVPTARRPRLGSVTLPPGRAWVPEETYGPPPRRAVAWVTDEGTGDGFSLARTLVGVFPDTGLWPCLWLDADRPASYCSPIPRLAPIDASRTEAILREQWQRHPPQAPWVAPLGTDFPGLAEATTTQLEPFDAFVQLELWQSAFAASTPNALTPRLLLVPCTQPADAVAAMHLICGSPYAGVENPGDVSSVLRSWERRFAAVLVAAQPGALTVAVGAPPHMYERALRIAAEQFALAPREDAGAPGALGAAAHELLAGNPPYTQSGRDIWTLGWND
jgi:Domain of unknown function (DUF4253)